MHSVHSTHLLLSSAVGVAVLCTGCGDGRPERIPVSGTVLIDGAPLAYGSIMFLNDHARPAGAMIGPDGRFVLSCFARGDGALPGHHRVKISAQEALSERSVRWHAPKRYADEATSDIEVDITEPVDDLKIELTWGGGQPFDERW
jgi:hypothetical protein